MIILLAGTSDGREIAASLAGAGHQVIACTTTGHGARLLKNSGAGEVITGRLDRDQLASLILTRQASLVIDATHPYAEEATANARGACSVTGVPYVRFQRPPLTLPESPLMHQVTGYEEAAETAVGLGKVIFLTTGVKTLSIFFNAAVQAGKRVVARILPDVESVRRCLEAGIPPGDIIAMQGPFSTALNQQLFLHYGADVLVTKESGAAGGTDAKLEAALALSLPAVVIMRPPVPDGAVASIEELLALISDLKGR